MDESSLEFDMVGIDAAIANAFRRILLAEVFGGYGGKGEVVWGNCHSLTCRIVPSCQSPLFFLQFW